MSGSSSLSLFGAKRRYATYLRGDQIQAMQRIAFERRRKDYEVFQDAVDRYLTQQGLGGRL
jgi:hypothetical protein